MEENDSNVINNLKNMVDKALDLLYEREFYLFENDLSERNMVFHFSRYFSLLLVGTCFEDYNLDCEYSKNKLDQSGYKCIIYNYDNKEHKIYPDFILHRRGNNKYNILAIEFKKYNNRDRQAKYNDYLKLKALTNSNGEFKYRLGLFIVLGKTRSDVKITTFIKGKEIVEKSNRLGLQQN